VWDDRPAECMGRIHHGARGQESIDGSRIAQMGPGLPGQGGGRINDDNVGINGLDERSAVLGECHADGRVGTPLPRRCCTQRTSDGEAAAGWDRAQSGQKQPGCITIQDLPRLDPGCDGPTCCTSRLA
jgi:hypothetical protein